MNVFRTVIFLSLFVCVFCQDSTNDATDAEGSLPTTSTKDGITAETTAGSTEAPSLEIGSTEGSTAKKDDVVTKSTIDTNHDIVITGASVPEGEGTDQPILTTVYDDTNTTAFTTPREEDRTACSSNPCRNGGTCVDDDLTPSLFSCMCPAGYVGIRCGTTDKCAEGTDGELCNGGACVYSKDGLERSCYCFTGTYWDEVNKKCRESDPPCFPNPCMNGGTCSSKDDLVICDCLSGFQGNNCSVQDKCGDCEKGSCVLDDKRTTKYCKCDSGLYWNEEKRKCEDMVSPCYSSPCRNGGTCDAVTDTEYNCTCQSGFSGKTCDVIDRCSTNEDCGHGTCMLSEDKTKRICHCDRGSYLEEMLHKCEEIVNVCQPNPCLNDGMCTVLSTTAYNCTCSEGYIGVKCEIRDLCKMDGGNGYCGNGICGNNFELGVYYCTCKDEEYFQYKERKCVELDLCPLVECGSTEACSMGKCVCKENYRWNNETKACEPDFCSSNPCPVSKMSCKEGTGSTDYKCSCKEGYAFNGTHCTEAVCIFPTLNGCDQFCSPKETGYECRCDDEFKLKEDNHTCSYTGNHTCPNKICDGGFCVQKNGGEVCLCPPGYVEVDGNCTDICSGKRLRKGVCPLDECDVTEEGGFRCKCEGKFAYSEDKVTCTVRNICQKDEVGWKTCSDRNAKCVKDWESSEGFMCQCDYGQVQTEGGLCRDVCNLENNQRQCSIKGASCDVDTKGKMMCKCPPYFKENERDGKCTQPADYSYTVTLPLDKSTYQIRNRRRRSLDTSIDYKKVSKDITVTIREMFTDFRRASALSCKSAPTHILCKFEIQFESEHKIDLKRLETEDICLMDGNSNKCLLPPLLVLVKNRITEEVNIQETDPCDGDIKEMVCGSETTCVSSLSYKSFNCSCKAGFYSTRKTYPFGNTRSFIESCADIDECAEGDPCPKNSICFNTIGNYTCSCKPGFRSIDDTSGSNTEKCVELCNPNPCTHGQCSTRGDHEFDCRCEAGYRGTFCNLQDENFKRARTNTIIVGVVLGGILLITFILFAACVSRLRKKKSLENPAHLYYNTAEMTERRRVEGGAINNAFQRE